MSRHSAPATGLAAIALIAIVMVGCSIATPQSASVQGKTAAATATASAGTSASPSLASVLTGRILFTRAGGEYGDGAVFTANADGSGEVRITDTCCPRWSWDGTRILGAALDGQRITTQVLNRDGSFVGKVPLPPGTLNLGPGTWAPDGKRICFDGFGATSDEGLYVGSVEGGGLVRLTHKRGQTVDFTPDGKRVVYFEAVPGFESGGNPDEPNGSLFVINADGSGKANQVTPKAMQIGNLGGYIARISRDGDWLVFAAEEAIWKIHVDGTGLTKVYQRDDGRIILSPTWSPDGQYIMFGLDPPGTFSVNNPPNSLVVIRADGSGLSEVITSPDFKVGPDWTP